MNTLKETVEKHFNNYRASNYDKHSTDYFKAAVTIAINEYHIPIQKIAEEFQVADSTVERWSRGVAFPHEKFRQLVLEWIVNKI